MIKNIFWKTNNYINGTIYQQCPKNSYKEKRIWFAQYKYLDRANIVFFDIDVKTSDNYIDLNI